MAGLEVEITIPAPESLSRGAIAVTHEASDGSKRATTKCRREFSCLKGDGKDLCAVEMCVGEEVHFIKPLERRYCSYRHSFGNANFCACPVRKELYNKFKI